MMRPVLFLAVLLLWAVGLWRRQPMWALICATGAVAGLYMLRYRLRDARWRRHQTILEQLLTVDAVAHGGAAGERLAQAVAARGKVAQGPDGALPAWVRPLLEVPIFVLLSEGQSGAATLLQHAGPRWHCREVGPVWGAMWWVADSCLVVWPQAAVRPYHGARPGHAAGGRHRQCRRPSLRLAGFCRPPCAACARARRCRGRLGGRATPATLTGQFGQRPAPRRRRAAWPPNSSALDRPDLDRAPARSTGC